MARSGSSFFRWFLLPIIGIAVSAAVFIGYALPASILFDLVTLGWLCCAPGILLVYLIAQWSHKALTTLELFSLGSALGLGVQPFFFSVLRALGYWKFDFLVTNIFILLLVLFALRSKQKTLDQTSFPFYHLWNIVWGAVTVVMLFLAWYNFHNFHYTVNGSLVTRSLFGVDIPWLIGEVASIKNTGELKDLHQFAIPWSYHESTYQLLASVSRITHDDVPNVIAFSAPIFGYVVALLSVFALVHEWTKHKYIALAPALASLLIGSFVGTEQGTSALSPSFVWGNILFLNALLVLSIGLRKEGKPSGFERWMLLLLCVLLARTKVSTYLMVEAGLSILLLAALLRKNKSILTVALPAWLVSGIVLSLFGASSNPLMPANDFIIGGPLLGYANHVASALKLPVSALSPVSRGLSLHLSQLLIIPYFIFHILRFAFVDGRLIIVLVTLLVFRKQLKQVLLPQHAPLLRLFLLVLIPLGFFLPVLYSPSWYPLALSFYTPLIGVEIAGLLAVSIAGVILINKELKCRSILLPIFAILLAWGVFGNTRSIVREDGAHADTVSSDRLHALRFLRAFSQPEAIVASKRYDFNLKDTINDESYYDNAAFSERPMLSEGSAYGSLLAAKTDLDTLKGLHPVVTAVNTLSEHRQAIDTIFQSSSLTQVQAALSKYHVAFMLQDKILHQTFGINPRTIADSLYGNSELVVWRVH